MEPGRTKGALWVRIAAWLTLGAVLVAALAGPAHRFGLLGFKDALAMLSFAGMVAGAGALVCLIAAIRTRPGTGKAGFRLALAGLVAGAGTVAVLGAMFQTAKSVPPIHDITTDTVSPPLFIEILPLRENAPNPPEYPGPEVAAQQKAAYPHIRTVTLPITVDDLFKRTVEAVKALGWEIVAVAPIEGRIEATDTTTWFGFKDDVVVRIVQSPGGATIDVRSKSRVGKSDLGANAARITRLIERVQQ